MKFFFEDPRLGRLTRQAFDTLPEAKQKLIEADLSHVTDRCPYPSWSASDTASVHAKSVHKPGALKSDPSYRLEINRSYFANVQDVDILEIIGAELEKHAIDRVADERAAYKASQDRVADRLKGI